MVKKYFNDLYKAGFGLTAIAHTKVKNIVEKGREDTEGYQVLTSNLPNSYECVFSDIFDCVVTGIVDKDIIDGKLTSSTRKLYFRDNCYVSAGCRFPADSVPEYMVFEGDGTAKEFIRILKGAMKSSIKKPISDKEFEDRVKEEKEEITEKLEEVVEKMDEKPPVSVDVLIGEIKRMISDPNKKAILYEIMKSSGKKINQFTAEELQDIIEKMNK